jgi:LuxR family maltose regulon positive regulatory protein
MHSVDTYQLLNTKLSLPRPRPTMIEREALFTRLDAGLQQKLTLLSAPAGFGKTTLVSQWLASRSERQDALSVAWLALDPGDNDPLRFWRYVLTATRIFGESINQSRFALLRSPQSPLEEMLTTFINGLTELTHPCILVLEDYHFITSYHIHKMLTKLLEHLPPMLHLVIITRSDPPLPLARLRAHGDLCELRIADLRFSQEEVRSFLCESLSFDLSSEAIKLLTERTEGWIAGLRLVTLALQKRSDPCEMERFLETFNGSNRHILEYLVTDVLRTQPEPLQNFLLRTAFLGRLTGALCNAVTGRNDSEQVLNQLERANLFLLPLDETGQWYRYHALFAEAMQHEARRCFSEAELHTLHKKAGQWYEQQGMFTEAVEALFLAQDFEYAIRIIESFLEPYYLNDEVLGLHTLRRWLEEIPQPIIHQHPLLCFAQAAVILLIGNRYQPMTRMLLEEPLSIAENYWRTEGPRKRLGEVQALRALAAWWQDDLAASFVASRQALEYLPKDEKHWRGICILHAGIEVYLAGRFLEARESFLEARILCEEVGNRYPARAALLVLADLCYWQGELHQAARFYEQVLAEAGKDYADAGNARLGLARLCCEWNDLAAAEQHIIEAQVFIPRILDEKYPVRVELALLALHQARGEIKQAQEQLHTLIVLTQQYKSPQLYREALLLQAQLALASGDLVTVQAWSKTRNHDPNDLFLHLQEREALLEARFLMAQGQVSEALLLLEYRQEEAHRYKRSHSKMEIRMLQALAYLFAGDVDIARREIREVLIQAQGEGYQRLFLNEGRSMAALLRAVLPDMQKGSQTAYVRNLLHAFIHEPGEESACTLSIPSSMSFMEPLSQQEQRVLRLLVSGHSNPEIARELVVSINTIKTQVQSIYRKLNVRGRLEASEVARRLQLL